MAPTAKEEEDKEEEEEEEETGVPGAFCRNEASLCKRAGVPAPACVLPPLPFRTTFSLSGTCSSSQARSSLLMREMLPSTVSEPRE